ncbi:MAG: ParB/RepB/Spo0J family partition protein [Candidatus Limnocylindrales bacterium]
MTAEIGRQQTGLGRGLAALIPHREETAGAIELPISAIARNPYQPRQTVEQGALEDLAASVAEHGVLQPILVTQTTTGYLLIAGERRLRAAEMAGLNRIPAVVRTATETDQLAWALIENLQRADLNSMEEARAFQRLVDEFGLGHEDIAHRVGRARSTVTNTMRLLELAPAVQEEIERGAISEGHGRAIGGVSDHGVQQTLLDQVVARGLSVRQTEELARRAKSGTPKKRTRTTTPDVERLERGLREVLATKVTLSSARKGGRITIEYYDQEDLERIYERLTGGRE